MLSTNLKNLIVGESSIFSYKTIFTEEFFKFTFEISKGFFHFHQSTWERSLKHVIKDLVNEFEKLKSIKSFEKRSFEKRSFENKTFLTSLKI